MSHNRYDAVVIGAGNSGIVAALELAQAGKKTLLIEKKQYAGRLLNELCARAL